MVTTLTVLTFTEGSAFAESTGFRRGMDGTASTDLGASARAVSWKGLLSTTLTVSAAMLSRLSECARTAPLRRQQFDAQVGRAASCCR